MNLDNSDELNKRIEEIENRPQIKNKKCGCVWLKTQTGSQLIEQCKECLKKHY